MIGGNEYILASTPISQSQLPSQTKITFSPTSSEVKVKFKYGTSAWTWHGHSICITKPVMVSETYYVDVCDGGEDKYRFGFNGQEKVNEISGIGNHYTAEFWEYDVRLGRRWNVDPEFMQKSDQSPFSTNANNPNWYSDPLGNLESTDVVRNADGTYKVVGATDDGDNNVYVVNNETDKQRTGEIIGQTLTGNSFIDDSKGPIIGAIIDFKDNSGTKFLNDVVDKELGIAEYASNAYGNQKYDFKAKGIDFSKSAEEQTRHYYRGMVLGNVKNMEELNNGRPTILSARDVGNLAAGYVAGNNGLTWSDTRMGFDGLEKIQQRKLNAVEGKQSQQAQRIGHRIGFRKWANEHPFQRLFKTENAPIFLK